LLNGSLRKSCDELRGGKLDQRALTRFEKAVNTDVIINPGIIRESTQVPDLSTITIKGEWLKAKLPER
jgi:hypothetical protein